MSEEITKKLNELPQEKLKELEQKLGLKIKFVYSVECLYCKAKFSDEIEDKAREKLLKHLEECKIALFIQKNFKPNALMGDIGTWVTLSEKLRKGKATEKEITQFRDLSHRILKDKKC